MRILLLLLLIFINTAHANTKCSMYADDCQYYLCIAEEKHCDKYSYPVQFGHFFCLKYEKKIQSFTANGKRWVEDVRRCLIKEMSQFDDAMTCSELRPNAFRSHVPCYQQNGFCELSMYDKRLILKTIWPTLRNIQVLSGGYDIIKSCL